MKSVFLDILGSLLKKCQNINPWMLQQETSAKINSILEINTLERQGGITLRYLIMSYFFHWEQSLLHRSLTAENLFTILNLFREDVAETSQTLSLQRPLGPVRTLQEASLITDLAASF